MTRWVNIPAPPQRWQTARLLVTYSARVISVGIGSKGRPR